VEQTRPGAAQIALQQTRPWGAALSAVEQTRPWVALAAKEQTPQGASTFRLLLNKHVKG
jgi:hypothetical protein